MSLIARILRRWGYVKLQEYGHIVTPDGRIPPIGDPVLAAPTWESHLPVPVLAGPAVVSPPEVEHEEDEEEWEWQLAMARARAKVEAAADAAVATVKRLPTANAVPRASRAPASISFDDETAEHPVDQLITAEYDTKSAEPITLITPAVSMAEAIAACRGDGEDEPTVVRDLPAGYAVGCADRRW